MTENTRLPRRPLGRTGLQVTPLALAAMAIRCKNPPGGKLAPEDVERAYYEHGLNTFLVTRQMKAMAEGVRRLIRAGHRDDLVLIGESGLLPFGPVLRRACEKNAQALGIDALDVWLMGWVRGRWHVAGQAWPTMQALKAEGKTRAIGFSCHDRPLATALARELAVDVLMIRYNAAHRGAEREVFAPLGSERPGIIAYTATRWGMLLQPHPGFPTAMTAPECYRFSLSHPSVDTVLCAARSPGEVHDDAAGVAEGPLSDERLAEIRRFGDAVHAAARGGLKWMFR